MCTVTSVNFWNNFRTTRTKSIRISVLQKWWPPEISCFFLFDIFPTLWKIGVQFSGIMFLTSIRNIFVSLYYKKYKRHIVWNTKTNSHQNLFLCGNRIYCKIFRNCFQNTWNNLNHPLEFQFSKNYVLLKFVFFLFLSKAVRVYYESFRFWPSGMKLNKL